MEHQQKRILFIGLGAVLILGLVLVVASYCDQGTRSETPVSVTPPITPPITPPVTPPVTPPQQQEESQGNDSWLSFDSKKDAGLRSDVRFNYPADWFHNGSHDGGTVSSVPFFDTTKYSKKCETTDRGSVRCLETGRVAEMVISGSSFIAKEIPYKDQKSEKITIDGRMGTKISGIVTEEGFNYIAPVGQRETRVVVMGVNGRRYDFFMITENPAQDELLNKIIESTKFGNE